MDRILIICGSAGRGGVTETMCRVVEDTLRSRGYDAVVVYPSEMRIGHCTGCDSCRDGPCVIDDDMGVLYRLFSESDLVILASPIHFSGPSSVIKTVMDRFQMYWHCKDLPHPLGMAAMLCAGSDRPNFGPTVSIMKAFAITTGVPWVGHLEIPGTDESGDEGVEEKVMGFLEGLMERGEDAPKSCCHPPSWSDCA